MPVRSGSRHPLAALVVTRKVSVPGLVKISIRPYPNSSYSAEKGFWLIRISRIDAFGGSEIKQA